MFLRALLLLWGTFALVNALVGCVWPTLDGNVWWVDLHSLRSTTAAMLLLIAGAGMIAYALLPRHDRGVRWMIAILLLVPQLMLLTNTIQFYQLLREGIIESSIRVPATLLCLLILIAASVEILLNRPMPTSRVRRWVGALLGAGTFAAFPLLLIVSLGTTRYDRPVDAIVVLGARVYADGKPSLAIFDRTSTAVRLYQKGLAPVLIFSGGPGDGAVSETDAMRAIAESMGVPPEAILLDPSGINTAATAQGVVGIARERGFGRVLAVSHGYHLPRVKLAFRRAGMNVFTVPAEETRTLSRLPWFVTREIAGWWGYYFGWRT